MPDGIQFAYSNDVWYTRMFDLKQKELFTVLIHSGLVFLLSQLPGLLSRLPLADKVPLLLLQMPFIIISVMALFFWFRRRSSITTLLVVELTLVLGFVISTLYPFPAGSNTLILSIIHIPLMYWLVLGIVYLADTWRQKREWMKYIRFSGEFFIYSALIFCGLAVFFVISSIIFATIGIVFGDTFLEHIVMPLTATVPIIAAWLVETKRSVIESITPVLAKIFSPLFLVAILIFTAVLLISGRGINMERETLISFDLILVLVLGMVIYSISNRQDPQNRQIFDIINTALIATTLVVDITVLANIITRLSEYGVSPNKLAALGENILLFINLSGLLYVYVRFLKSRKNFEGIGGFQTGTVPAYIAWFFVVGFLFPLIFRFA